MKSIDVVELQRLQIEKLEARLVEAGAFIAKLADENHGLVTILKHHTHESFKDYIVEHGMRVVTAYLEDDSDEIH